LAIGAHMRGGGGGGGGSGAVENSQRSKITKHLSHEVLFKLRPYQKTVSISAIRNSLIHMSQMPVLLRTRKSVPLYWSMQIILKPSLVNVRHCHGLSYLKICFHMLQLLLADSDISDKINGYILCSITFELFHCSIMIIREEIQSLAWSHYRIDGQPRTADLDDLDLPYTTSTKIWKACIGTACCLENSGTAVAGTNLMSLDLSGRRGFGLYMHFSTT
jgi:hypothetical protein